MYRRPFAIYVILFIAVLERPLRYLWSADNKSIPWFTDIHQASLDAVAANTR